MSEYRDDRNWGRGRGGRAPPSVSAYQLPGGAIPVPDTAVTELENSPGSSTGRPAGPKISERLPKRPSYGREGQDIVLWANYFRLKISEDLVLYQYSIAVEPKAIGKKLGRVVGLFLESSEFQNYRYDTVTDFRSTLIARQKLAVKSDGYTVPYRAEGEDEPRKNATTYTLKLDLKKTLSVADLINYLTSGNVQSLYDEKLQIVQALNILINHHAKLSDETANVGSSKNFSLSGAETQDLGGGLTAIRGFFTSVRAATGRMLLNVNVSNTVVFDPIPLNRFISNFLRSNNNNRAALARALEGRRITTNHLPEKKNKSGKTIARPKTIRGLATPDDGCDVDGNRSEHPPHINKLGAGSRDVMFWYEQPGTGSSGAEYISVHDYFRKKYNMELDASIPVVNVGAPGKPSYLPAEVCDLSAGQHPKNKLSSAQTANMIKFAVRLPSDNAKSIVSEGLTTIGISDDKFEQRKSFGVDVSPGLVTVHGRVLAEPAIRYHNQKEARVNDGSWNMQSGRDTLRFSVPKRLEKWACLRITGQQNAPSNTESLLRDFTQTLTSTGIVTAKPLAVESLERPGKSGLDEYFQRTVKRGAILIFVILPTTASSEYNLIKQLGDVRHGVHTICGVDTTIQKQRDMGQYLRNLALKVNLKLGGTNQRVQTQNLGLIVEKETMVVGIDVTHPSPGSLSKAPSISAMVASIDKEFGQWPGILSLQDKSREEIVSNLGAMLKTRLALWRRSHNDYPENILVYRDGVSEGQYQEVLNKELPQLKAACTEVYPAPDTKRGLPRITLVIVGKRHNTRFFVTKAEDGDRSGNAPAGTVVDRGVTEARSWDFFLQSHAAIKGTARPAHYFVVLDEIFRHSHGKRPNKNAPMKNVADELQRATQAMCYVFGRATKAVSYCTPAYHADILCERARRYLGHVFDPDSDDSSDAGTANPKSLAERIMVHERLKNTMFYI